MTVNFTNFYRVEDTESFLIKSKPTIKNFARNFKKLSSGKIEFFLKDTVVKASWIDGLRLILECFEEDNKIIRDIVAEGFISVEKMHPGSGYFYLIAFLQGLMYNSNDCYYEEIHSISKLAKRADLSELKASINLNEDEFIKSFVDFIINQAGFNCSFSLKETPQFNSRFIVSSSYDFPIAAPVEFFHGINVSNISIFDSKAIVYDGVIESVGEIHHVLSYFSENKLDLILVARGFSDDVINTLAVNYNRKSLRVIPARLLFSLESINSLKDFSVAADAEFVDSTSGKSISSLDFKELRSIHHIEIDHLKCAMRNSRTSSRVLSLVFQINKKIEATDIEEKKEILRKRVASLNGRKTTIYLGQHLRNAKGITRDRILSTIGILNTISRHGILNLKEIEGENLINLRSIVNFLTDSNMELVPAACFIHGTLNGFKTANQVKNGSYMLLLDNQ